MISSPCTALPAIMLKTTWCCSSLRATRAASAVQALLQQLYQHAALGIPQLFKLLCAADQRLPFSSPAIVPVFPEGLGLALPIAGRPAEGLAARNRHGMYAIVSVYALYAKIVKGEVELRLATAAGDGALALACWPECCCRTGR